MSARDELRDCFLSDSRERFENAADAYRAEVLREAAVSVLSRIAAYEGMGQDVVCLNRERTAISELLRRMADEGGAS